MPISSLKVCLALQAILVKRHNPLSIFRFNKLVKVVKPAQLVKRKKPDKTMKGKIMDQKLIILFRRKKPYPMNSIKIIKKFLLFPFHAFAQYAPGKPINTPDKGKGLFLDNGRKYEFPGAETEKPVFISCHHPVNKSRAATGIANNKNRLCEFYFPPFREKNIIEQETDTIEDLNQGEDREKCH
jgi:hypothetical protein